MSYSIENTAEDENDNPASPSANPVAAPRLSMQLIANRHRTTIHYFLVALLLANAGCLAYYLFFGYQFRFHSDSAVANLLAQEIHTTGQYFPKEWNYVYGDLWVLCMQTWTSTLYPLIPNGFFLHGAGGLIGCILTGAATWGICGVMGMTRSTRLFVLALLSAGFTPSLNEHMYGQQAYGTIYYLACMVLFFGWKTMQAHGAAAWRWGAASLLITMLVTWANPQRALIYHILPLFSGMGALVFTASAGDTSKSPSRSSCMRLFAITVAGFAIGMLMYRFTLATNSSLSSPISMNWVDAPTMAANAGLALNGLVGLLGGFPSPGKPLATSAGAIDALRMLSGIVILMVIPCALLKSLPSRYKGQSFVAAAALASIGASLFICLTSTLIVDAPAEDGVRYVVPGLMLSLLVVIAFLAHHQGTDQIKRMAAIPALGILVLSAPIASGLIDLPRHLAAGGLAQANPKTRLAHFLQAQGLQYGYSTFWHAGQTTVLSNDTVKVRQIQIVKGLPIPMRHLSSNRWYEPSAWQGPSFLLLTEEELSIVNLPEIEKFTGKPVRRLVFEGYQIIVFGHNIAENLPKWQLKITKPVQYPATASSSHAVGSYNPDSQAITADKGVSGALRFGPYITLVGGHYQATFDIQVDASVPDNFGYVDIVAKAGEKKLATHIIDRVGRQKITLPFSFDGMLEQIELRVYTSGVGKFTSYNIELANDKRN